MKISLLVLFTFFLCSLSNAQFAPFSVLVEIEYGGMDLFPVDFDFDGDLDFVHAGADGLAWHENMGDGSFAQHILTIPIGGFLVDVDLVDFDMDGDYDIPVLGGFDDTGYLINLGDETFESGAMPGLPGWGIIKSGDIDADGDPDFIVTNSEGDHTLNWNEGDGLGGIVDFHELEPATSYIYDFILVDFDEDTDLDIIWGSVGGGGEVCYLENLGGGTFADRIIVDAGTSNPTSICTADLDGDLDLDIIHGSWADGEGGKIYWNENLGGGIFADRILISDAFGGENYVEVGDLDLDGDIDLVTASYDGLEVLWFENLGDGTFEAPEIMASDLEYVGDIELGDFDGDGDLDVYAICQIPQSIIWFENATINPFHVEGQLYVDANENGIKDGSETGLPWSTVLSDPEGTVAMSYIDGTYAMSFLGLPDGDYDIYPDLSDWNITSAHETYNVTVSDDFTFMDTLDFGLFPSEFIDSVGTDLTGGLTARCQDTVALWLNISNAGTTLPSGIMHLSLDDSLVYVTADIVPDSIVGQNIYWSYDSLYYYASESFMVQVGTPDGIDDTVTSVLTATILVEGEVVFITIDDLTQPISCAYDPNDKTPDPIGEGPEGNIPTSTEWIEYTIRFQNTGTDYAEDVIIRDQLDENLIWTSIEPLYASHEMTFEFDPSGEVAFVFNDIMLLDSNTNEIESHGFVQYRIKLKPDLALGSTIENTAEIYFDLSPAVVTNTTLNTLAEPDVVDVSLTDFNNNISVSVYPNPADDFAYVTVDMQKEFEYSIRMYSVIGQTVYLSENLSIDQTKINISQFDKGLYILVIESIADGQQIYNTKLVIE